MSKLTTELDDDLTDQYDDEDIADDDYVFVIGPNGELKSVLVPDDAPFELPENVARILEVYGISDVDNIDGNATLH